MRRELTLRELHRRAPSSTAREFFCRIAGNSHDGDVRWLYATEEERRVLIELMRDPRERMRTDCAVTRARKAGGRSDGAKLPRRTTDHVRYTVDSKR